MKYHKLYCYFYSKYSDKLYSSVPPVQTFATRNGHTMYTGLNLHIHSLHVLLVRRKLYLDSFFTRISTLWNRVWKTCFTDHYNHNFKSRVNYLTYIFSYSALTLPFYEQHHSITLYLECLYGLGNTLGKVRNQSRPISYGLNSRNSVNQSINPDYYNFNHFISKVNHYLFYIFS